MPKNSYEIKPNLNAIKKAYIIEFFIFLILLLLVAGLFFLDIRVLKWNFFSALLFIPMGLLGFAVVFQPKILEKSWLIDKIFGTGSIDIFTAGIGTFGLKIRYVDNPDIVLLEIDAYVQF